MGEAAKRPSGSILALAVSWNSGAQPSLRMKTRLPGFDEAFGLSRLAAARIDDSREGQEYPARARGFFGKRFLVGSLPTRM